METDTPQDLGAFALSNIESQQNAEMTTVETIIPKKTKKRVRPPPRRQNIENKNYQSSGVITEITDSNDQIIQSGIDDPASITNQLFAVEREYE